MAEAATEFPVKKEGKEAGAAALRREWEPFETLRREVDRLFEDFHQRSWPAPFRRSLFDIEPFWRGEKSWGAVPAVDVVDKGTAYEVSAELPGIEEKDIAVTVAEGMLTITGEKKETKEEKKEDYFLSERRYGSFQRAFTLPQGVDQAKIDATFSKGVLTVRLPKKPEAVQKERKIAVTAK